MAKIGGFIRGLPEWRWIYPTQPGETRYAENVLTGERISVRQAQNRQQATGVTKRIPGGIPGPTSVTPRGPVTYTKQTYDTTTHGDVVGYYFNSLEEMQAWFIAMWTRQDPKVTHYAGWLIEVIFSAKYKQATTNTAKRPSYRDSKGRLRYKTGYASLSSTYWASEDMAKALSPAQVQAGLLTPWEDASLRIEWYKIDKFILYGVQK